MEPAVKRRAYSSPRRAQAARQTKAAILTAARDLFIIQGYAGTTVAAIAEDAGVAVDTVYAAVGRKPQVFRLLLESALSGTDEEVPALERDYVKQIEATSDAVAKLAIYAEAVTSIQGRLAPLFVVVRQAAATEPELAALWASIAERRLTNMRLFAASLHKTGQLRPGLSIEKVADIVWSMNSSDYYLLLVKERGWSPEEFEGWLLEAWQRLLLTG
jgi:AcrR family transcriptional regulator